MLQVTHSGDSGDIPFITWMSVPTKVCTLKSYSSDITPLKSELHFTIQKEFYMFYSANFVMLLGNSNKVSVLTNKIKMLIHSCYKRPTFIIFSDKWKKIIHPHLTYSGMTFLSRSNKARQFFSFATEEF